MYSTAHYGVATPIVLTSFSISSDFMGLAIGGFLAIASHYPVDYLKEASIGKFFSKEYIKWETMLIGLTFIFGAFWGFDKGGGYGMLILLGLLTYSLVCSIGMDLIDKKFGLSMKYPDKYKSTFYFHKQKTGIQLSVSWTKFSQIIGMAIAILSIILIYK